MAPGRRVLRTTSVRRAAAARVSPTSSCGCRHQLQTLTPSQPACRTACRPTGLSACYLLPTCQPAVTRRVLTLTLTRTADRACGYALCVSSYPNPNRRPRRCGDALRVSPEPDTDTDPDPRPRLLACGPAFLSASACRPASDGLPAFLPTCQPACLRACASACLPAGASACFPVCRPVPRCLSV